MISKKSLLITLSLTICSVANSYAQRDYIIDGKKDTLQGSIKSHSTHFVEFQQLNTTEKIKYSPEQIMGFYIAKNGENYEPVKVDKEQGARFLHILEKGKINLFELIIPGPQTKSVYWYAAKGEIMPVEVISDESIMDRKGKRSPFYRLLKDNDELTDKFIMEDKFTFKQIRELVKQYNSVQKP